jgi:hypothetical protein
LIESDTQVKLQYYTSVDTIFYLDKILYGQKISSQAVPSIEDMIRPLNSEESLIYVNLEDGKKWLFTNDNRLSINSKDTSLRYSEEGRYQYYAIQNHYIGTLLYILGRSDKIYKIVSGRGSEDLVLMNIICDTSAIKLKYLKDTLIENTYTSVKEIAEGNNDKIYFSSWAETAWHLNILSSDIFLLEPHGHFNIGQVYMGNYEFRDGIYDLEYYEDPIGNLKDLGIARLFMVDSSNIITEGGQIFRLSQNYDEILDNQLSDLPELINYCSLNMAEESGIDISFPRESWIEGKILAIYPQVRVQFSLNSRADSGSQIIDTMTIDEMKRIDRMSVNFTLRA